MIPNSKHAAELLMPVLIDLQVQSTCRSIQQFADKFLDQNPKLDCIINNAGVFMPEHKKTPEGFEARAIYIPMQH